MRTSLELSCVSNLQDLQDLAREWCDLCTVCSATPFQRPEWLLPWVESFGPAELWVIAARNHAQLVGLAPMFIYDREGERTMAPIGAGITDYLDWLIDPALQDQCCGTILAQLEGADWNTLEVMDLPSRSPLLRESVLADWTCERCDTCPVIHIPAGAEFNKVVPSHQRRNLNTARNRIHRAGRWQLEIANEDTLEEYLDTLFRLHHARWNGLGEPGVLANPTVRDFHRRSAPLLLRCGTLRFYGIRFQGQLIAVLHTLVGRDTIHCYLQGFDPAYGEFSPGMLIVEAVVRDAIREGKSAVDFLRGREKYKYGWGAQDRATFRIRAKHSAGQRQVVSEQAA